MHVGAKLYQPQNLPLKLRGNPAIRGVRALNIAGTTSPFSSLLDPVTLQKPHYRRKLSEIYR